MGLLVWLFVAYTVRLVEKATELFGSGLYLGALVSLEGYPLLRTDRNGWIELTTNGEQMWMEAERG